MSEDEREAEREARWAERHAQRDAEREARRAERGARRAERQRMRAEFRSSFGRDLRDRIRDEVKDSIRGAARAWAFEVDRGGARGAGSEASEVVERRFEVSGMPRVRVSNVSGETEVTPGPPNEVFVRARKRVRGWSEERARRLLENVEIRMEQDGNEIVIEPRLFQQERGWLELFRGGRVAVDLDIRVPRETQLDARTVSGDLSVSGTRGPIELQSVSGEVGISDVQGPMRLRTVSGDVTASGYAGQLEANSVSGGIGFDRSRVRTPDIVTVSGEVDIDALHLPAGSADGRVKTVSGEVEIALAEPNAEVEFRTVSGDADVEGPARVENEGRRDRRITIGAGGPQLRVKTVSGDLSVRMSQGAPTEDARPEAEETIPMGPPEAVAEPVGGAGARGILERVARGELSVEHAAAALDDARQR